MPPGLLASHLELNSVALGRRKPLESKKSKKTLANLCSCGVFDMRLFMRPAANSSIFDVGGLCSEVESVDCDVLQNSGLKFADNSTSDNGTRAVFRKRIAPEDHFKSLTEKVRPGEAMTRSLHHERFERLRHQAALV